jgi:hypothetical protein
MTPVNMAKHRSNPNAVLEMMRKAGIISDPRRAEGRFLREEKRVRCIKAPNATRDPVFDASPSASLHHSDELADAVRERNNRTPPGFKLIERRRLPLNTGVDGGMNKIFAARVPEGNTGLSEGGDSQSLASLTFARAPGTIPATVNPPRAPSDNLLLGAPQEPKIAAAPAPTAGPTRVANAAPAAQSDGFFSTSPEGRYQRHRRYGGKHSKPRARPPPPSAKPKVIEAKRSEPPHPAAAPKAETKQAAAKPALKPSVSDTAAAAAPAPAPAQVAGSAPIVSTSSFDSRFWAVK